MIRRLAWAAALTAVSTLVVSSALAEPVTLKFAYFTSDRTSIYRSAIKPFVDAVNAEPDGHVKIEVAFSGELGRNPAEQADLVRDGVADIAFVVPGYRPDLFPDNAVIELPGFYSDMAEASRVYLRLVEAGALRGYEDFYPIGILARHSGRSSTIGWRRRPRADWPDEPLAADGAPPPRGRRAAAVGGPLGRLSFPSWRRRVCRRPGRRHRRRRGRVFRQAPGRGIVGAGAFRQSRDRIDRQCRRRACAEGRHHLRPPAQMRRDGALPEQGRRPQSGPVLPARDGCRIAGAAGAGKTDPRCRPR